jgi:uracil-DNA glycosylase
MKESDIYIIPLPHPSKVNNAYWTEAAWSKLTELIECLT